MPYQGTPLVVTATDRPLERWSRSGRTERRRADRARLVLGAAEGQGTRAIARQLHVRAATVSKWCSRFRTHGLAGLRDRARPGAPVKYAETTQRILRQLDAPTAGVCPLERPLGRRRRWAIPPTRCGPCCAGIASASNGDAVGV